jgi:nitroimidazol reductase NimA-like FMN-containing flavoprotein (pyridoxamine 5'-phosphate oxidase superfamily)
MPPELHHKILDILAHHNNMRIATLRPDGFPQVTTVGYANDGLTIYFGCGVQSQKAHNIAHDSRVSAAIDEDHENWGEIEELSLGGTAARVTDPDEIAKANGLFTAKFPQVSAFSEDEIRTAMDLYRLTPSVISVLDYTKGFGHTDLVRV